MKKEDENKKVEETAKKSSTDDILVWNEKKIKKMKNKKQIANFMKDFKTFDFTSEDWKLLEKKVSRIEPPNNFYLETYLHLP